MFYFFERRNGMRPCLLTFLSLVLLLLAGFSANESVWGQKEKNEGVTGTWDNVAKAPNGLIFKYKTILVQKGNKVTGFAFDPVKKKKKVKILKGKVKGKKITFYHFGEFDGKKFKASYEGTIGRTGIKGQIEVEFGEEGDFLTWKATRAKANADPKKKKQAEDTGVQ